MQLSDITKPLDQMTDEELMEKLKAIRHNREVVRPSAAKKAAAPAKKESRAKVSGAVKLTKGLTPEQIQTLINELTSGDKE